jgi:hypothetical protein
MPKVGHKQTIHAPKANKNIRLSHDSTPAKCTSINRQNTIAPHKQALDFQVISVGVWPDSLSLHREDMYGDDGR